MTKEHYGTIPFHKLYIRSGMQATGSKLVLGWLAESSSVLPRLFPNGLRFKSGHPEQHQLPWLETTPSSSFPKRFAERFELRPGTIAVEQVGSGGRT